MKRVGHKGADAVAPGNTLESFEAAVEAGVDMIEFDVLPVRGPGGERRLVLAHDHEDAATRKPLSLDEALDQLAGERYEAVELDVDLKLPGHEREVVEAIEARALEGRALISSTYPEALDRVGELAPALRRGWSVPRARRDYTRSALAVPAYGIMRYWRARLPGRAAEMLRSGRCEAVMSHWLLVSRRLVSAVQGAGGELYVWTVDDPARIRRLEELGVDGVITNDPRVFTGEASADRADLAGAG